MFEAEDQKESARRCLTPLLTEVDEWWRMIKVHIYADEGRGGGLTWGVGVGEMAAGEGVGASKRIEGSKEVKTGNLESERRSFGGTEGERVVEW